MASDSKTEQPTPRRRQKAREKGQVARSRDLMGNMAVMTTVMMLAASSPALLQGWRGFFAHSMAVALAQSISVQILMMNVGMLRPLALIVGLSWMAAVAGALLQGGLVFAPASLAPQLSRMSITGKLKELFSLPAAGRLVKSLLPAAAMAYVAVRMMLRDWSGMARLANGGSHGIAGFGLGHLFEFAWKAALVLLVWSGADYLLQRRKLESDLRMSRQELVDEMKETEGHPAIKARIRRLQRQVRRRRMLQEVRRAAVVVTNPTHFAIALEYGPHLAAPTVIAKGQNLLAQQIKLTARWHEIPIVENPPLAHALYRAVEVGQSIPPKLYAVVANILAAIYRAQQRAQQPAGVR